MPQPPALSEEQADKAMRWLKENDPDRAEKLARLREERPEMHAHVLRESWEQMNHLSRLKEHDPAEYERMMKQQKLERAAGALAEKIRRSEAEEEREKLTAQLREHLASLFDMRETGREREVKEMERRLADLRKVLAERQSRKAEIIERRVGQMIGRGDALEW
jgi:plasmid stabilization system protein ParE